jgi:hypothetical protein
MKTERLTFIQLSNEIEDIAKICELQNYKVANAEIKAKLDAAKFDGLVVQETLDGLYLYRPDKGLKLSVIYYDAIVVFDYHSNPDSPIVIGSFTWTAEAVATALSVLGYKVVFNAEENPETIHVETEFTKPLATSEQACCKKLAEAFTKLAKYARQDDATLDNIYDFIQPIVQTIVDVRDDLILVSDDCLTVDMFEDNDLTLEK